MDKEGETLTPGTDEEHPIGDTEQLTQGAAKHSDSPPTGEHTHDKEEETIIQEEEMRILGGGEEPPTRNTAEIKENVPGTEEHPDSPPEKEHPGEEEKETITPGAERKTPAEDTEEI